MTAEQLRLAVCGLCGDQASVERRPTTWTDEATRELGKKGPWDVVDRCRDEQACRQRVEQVLEAVWPLRDHTVPTVREPSENPMPPIAVPAAVAGEEEDIEWMR